MLLSSIDVTSPISINFNTNSITSALSAIEMAKGPVRHLQYAAREWAHLMNICDEGTWNF